MPRKSVHKSTLNPYPCQLFILWDFVHFLCCGILSCGILSCGILSYGILSGYHLDDRRVMKEGSESAWKRPQESVMYAE